MKCILCGSKNFKDLYILNKNKIVECQNCGLVKTLGKQSVNYESYHRDKDYTVYDAYFKNIFQKRFNIIKNKKKVGKILDIGASTGTLMEIFKENGWEEWGIEPSGAYKVAQKRGLRIKKGEFEKIKLPLNYFDVVVMNHTLEHVENPLVVLVKIYKLLKVGGVVYIDVPNFDSLSRRIAKQNWKYLLPQEHVHHFTPDTLKKLFKKAGYKVEWYQTWSGIFDVANPFLKFWQTLSGLKKQFFTDIFELPGNVIAKTLNKGTSLAMLGRKI